MKKKNLRALFLASLFVCASIALSTVFAYDRPEKDEGFSKIGCAVFLHDFGDDERKTASPAEAYKVGWCDYVAYKLVSFSTSLCNKLLKEHKDSFVNNLKTSITLSPATAYKIGNCDARR